MVRLRFGLDVWDKKNIYILGIETLCVPVHSLEYTLTSARGHNMVSVS